MSILPRLALLATPLALCAGLFTAHVRAEGNPQVRVNNVQLAAPEIAALGVLNCNTGVPSGDYWIDFQTGAWGYAGGGREGVLACYDAPITDPALAAARAARIQSRASIASVADAVRMP